MESNFFDHTYLVNLRHHRGQKLRVLSHLKSYGIDPTVFEASDGYAQPLFAKYEAYSKKKLGNLSHFKKFNKLEVWMNKLFIDSAGAYGYIDTYIQILKDAKLKGYKSILILEDDIILSNDFNERLENFLSIIPNSWKFLGLGASQYNWDSVDLDLAKKQGFYTPVQIDTCGSFAIAIKNTIFDELIELQSHFEAPFDHIPLGEIYRKYSSECFMAFPYMVMPDVRSSSIRGSRHQLTHAKKMKWEPSLFEYPSIRPIINLIITSKEQTKYLDAFSDKNSLPFELHLFVPSKDGLRPYHDASQEIEVEDDDTPPQLLNSGHCVRARNKSPITEESLLSLYESLILNKSPNDNFEIIEGDSKEIDKDRISVIIPTFKRWDILADVLLSVIEQDYKNKEIIVVDDNPRGSKDQNKTKRVVEDLIKKHQNTKLIYIIHEKNRKGAGARNTGIQHSTGNYICFLDDDDLYLQGRLSLSLEKLKNTPRYVGGVYCGFVGGNSAARTNERYNSGCLTLELLLLNYLAHFLNTNTGTYKREAIVSLNGFDETFIRHQDLEFNLRFFEHYEMCVVEKQLVSIRPRPTDTNNQQYGINLFKTKQKFLKKFQFIINRYDSATQKAIFDKHWLEVVKYAEGDESFEQELLSELSNGHLQCYKFLEREQLVKPHQVVSKPIGILSKKAQKTENNNVAVDKKLKIDEPIKQQKNNIEKEQNKETTKTKHSSPELKVETKVPSEPLEDTKLDKQSNKNTQNKVIDTNISNTRIGTDFIDTKNESVSIPKYQDLNLWQLKGAKTFGVIFSGFILPPQRRKLRNSPKAFFEDSKNSFTRSVGKLLKII